VMMDKVKTISAVTIIVVLILPVVQFTTGLIKVRPLQGAINEVKDVQFIISSWHDETYQKEKEKYLNQEFGFRNFFVRLNNQLYFSLFRIAKANSVVIGKENYLYEENYIKEYYGHNFIGQARINEVTDRLKSIDSAFKTINKTLLVVFAPGKASYYPEYIPDDYKKMNDSTNYKSFSKAIYESGISFIDFNDWFKKQKSISNIVLYPKTGIHWSDYGSILAIDSINKFIAKKLNHNPVEIHWTEFSQEESVSYVDSDIENGMNLLFKIKRLPMKYPRLQFDNAGKHKPKVLNIGDSFYWNIFGKGIANELFTDAGFGFYFREIHSPILNGIKDIAEIDLKDFMNHYDVVMLMCTEATLFNFPFEFDKKVYNLYCTDLSDKTVYNQRLEEIKNNIRNTPEWLKSITEKAQSTGKTVEEMINIDADYILQNK
jgi:hypothetical protein